jgi:Tropinone reductase 1
MLKASGDASVMFNSSVAGGPTAMKSGAIYAMTKGALCLKVTKCAVCSRHVLV